jgi:hypothetical protein
MGTRIAGAGFVVRRAAAARGVGVFFMESSGMRERSI